MHRRFARLVPRAPRRIAAAAAVHLALGAGYLGLAVLHTFPLAARLGTHIPGEGLGDNVSFLWNLWWMREALASDAYTFFSSPMLMAPLGASLVLHTHTALSAFAGATILRPLSIVEAQNVILVLSLALNGVAAYVLSYSVTRSRGPSALAGALFLVAPPIAVRLMGHYNLVVAWPLILACAALVKWWERPDWRRAVMLGLSAGLIPYADYYHAVYFGLFALAYSLLEWRDIQVTAGRRSPTAATPWLFGAASLAAFAGLAVVALQPGELMIGSLRISVRTPTNLWTAAWLLAIAGLATRWRVRVSAAPRRETPWRTLLQLVAAAAVCAVLVTPLVFHGLTLWRSGDYVTQTSALRSGPRGVDLATLVLGPPSSGILGPAVRQTYERRGIDWMESSAGLGIGVLVLVAVAVWTRGTDREVRRWLALGGVFLLWAAGPYLTVLGTNLGLLLPQALARLIPVVDNARIPGRAMVMVSLAAAVVACLGLQRVWAQPRPSARLLTVALAGLALLESLGAPLSLVRIPNGGVYHQLAGDAASGAVLPIPFGVSDGMGERGRVEHDALYAQTIHGRALVGGLLARVPQTVREWYDTHEPYRSLLLLSGAGPPVESQLSCEDIARGLEAAGVSHVVLYTNSASRELMEFVRSRMPLRRVSADGVRELFRVGKEC